MALFQQAPFAVLVACTTICCACVPAPPPPLFEDSEGTHLLQLRVKLSSRDTRAGNYPSLLPGNNVLPKLDGHEQFRNGYCPGALFTSFTGDGEATLPPLLHFRNRDSLAHLGRWYQRRTSLPVFVQELLTLRKTLTPAARQDSLFALAAFAAYPQLYKLMPVEPLFGYGVLLYPHVFFNEFSVLFADPAKAKYLKGGVDWVAYFIHPRVLGGRHLNTKGTADTSFFVNFFNDTGKVTAWLANRNVTLNLPFGQPLWPAPALHSETHTKTAEQLTQESDIRYYATLLDLLPSDVPSLRRAKAGIIDHLASVHDLHRINEPGGDSVVICFHFPINIDYSTLHLHAFVNQGMSDFAAQRSFLLDDVVDWLVSHGDVYDLVLKRRAFPKSGLKEWMNEVAEEYTSPEDIAIEVPASSREICDEACKQKCVGAGDFFLQWQNGQSLFIQSSHPSEP